MLIFEGAAKCEVSWLRKGRLKWNTFKCWIGADRHRGPKCNGKGRSCQWRLGILKSWSKSIYFHAILITAPNVSSVSASVRHPEDEAPMDVKMFIPYDSAKLCITQVCRYHSFMDYCALCIVFLLCLWINVSIKCNLSQNVLVQECIIFVIQEFWFASCTSHISTPSVVLGPLGGDETPHLMSCVVGSSRPIHDHTFLNNSKPRILTSSQKDKSQQVPVHTLSHFCFICPMQSC